MNLIKQIVRPGEYGTQTIKMIVRSNERGAQGEQGEKGEAATITAGQVYAVEEGQQAVINTGTPSDAVFDFYLPKGPKGDDGAIKYTAGTGIKITNNNVIEATGDATAAWGGIQGNIANQTDLQNEFGLYTKTADLPNISTAYVGTSNLVDGAVTTAKITDGSVTTAKIADGAVTTSKFAQYATNNAMITANNLTPTDDTPAGWLALFGGDGYYVTKYDTTGKFTNQPAQYGQLTTVITGSQVFQKFAEDNSVVWMRGASGNDWDINADGKFRIIRDGRTAFIGQGPVIPSNVDLNSTDYVVPGEYTTTGGAAATMTHCPTTNGFRMVVENIGRALLSDATAKGARLLRVLIDAEGAVYMQNVQSDHTPTWTFGSWNMISGGSSDGAISQNDFLTMNTGYTADYFYAYKTGKLVYLNLGVHKSSGNFGGSNESVATIKPAYIPIYDVNADCALISGGVYGAKAIGQLYITVGQSGAISVSDQNGTNSYNYAKICLTYPIA